MKSPHPRTIRLHVLMRTYHVSIDDVCTLLNRANGTVRKWRCGTPVIPENQLRLLELLSYEKSLTDRNNQSK